MLTSSGTTGEPSRIYLDRQAAAAQSSALAAPCEPCSARGGCRCCIVDTRAMFRDRRRSPRAARACSACRRSAATTSDLLDGGRSPMWSVAGCSPSTATSRSWSSASPSWSGCTLRRPDGARPAQRRARSTRGGWKKLVDQAVTPRSSARVRRAHGDRARPQLLRDGRADRHGLRGGPEAGGRCYCPDFARRGRPRSGDVGASAARRAGRGRGGPHAARVATRACAAHRGPRASCTAIDDGGLAGQAVALHGRVPRAEARGCSDTAAAVWPDEGRRRSSPAAGRPSWRRSPRRSPLRPTAPLPSATSVVEFLHGVSRELLGDRRSPGAIRSSCSLGFFLRKVEWRRWRGEFAPRRDPRRRPVPRGLVFHVPPANVDTIFVYSLGAVRAGRQPQRGARLAGRRARRPPILDALNDALADGPPGRRARPAHGHLRPGRRGRAGARCHARCDLRVIWGGDATVDDDPRAAAARRTPATDLPRPLLVRRLAAGWRAADRDPARRGRRASPTTPTGSTRRRARRRGRVVPGGAGPGTPGCSTSSATRCSPRSVRPPAGGGRRRDGRGEAGAAVRRPPRTATVTDAGVRRQRADRGCGWRDADAAARRWLGAGVPVARVDSPSPWSPDA